MLKVPLTAIHISIGNLDERNTHLRDLLQRWRPSNTIYKEATTTLQVRRCNSGAKAIKRFIRWVLVLGFVLTLKPPYPHTAAQTVEDFNNQATVNEQVSTVQNAKNEVQPVIATPAPVPQPEPPAPQPMSNRAIGEQMAATKGWTGSQWLCLEKLWTNESNWRSEVANYQGSGAYGIPQSLPASKMASHGADYLTNPRTQIAWGLDYISARYKTPCGALAFWNAQTPHHWY